MSNTPETDKAERMAYSQEYMVPTEFARKLERERDEANELLASEKITRNHIIKRSVEVERERDEAQAECLEQARLLGMGSEREARLISERDEAVEEIKEWKTLCLWGGTPEHIHGFIRGQQSRIQHLERERDDAREAILGWENKWRCAVDMAARAELERDDAFNKLKELKDILR
jgi:hypothetical protein